MSSSSSPSALQKEFTDLVNAMQNSQIPVFKRILEGKNGETFLEWKFRISNQVMTPIEIACNFFNDVETFREFFDCIRRIGGKELLKMQLSKRGLRLFWTVIELQTNDVIMFFLRTFFCLGERFMEDQLGFALGPNDDFHAVALLRAKEKKETNNEDGVIGAHSLEDIALILGHFLKKFGNQNYSSYPFGDSKADFEFFGVYDEEFFTDYQDSLIADFEKLAKEEEGKFDQHRTIKQEFKNEETEEEAEAETTSHESATIHQSAKLRIMQRELDFEKSAHEVTKEQLRIALKLADSIAGTRRQREEDADEEEEAPAPAPKKQKKAARKVSKKAK